MTGEDQHPDREAGANDRSFDRPERDAAAASRASGTRVRK